MARKLLLTLLLTAVLAICLTMAVSAKEEEADESHLTPGEAPRGLGYWGGYGYRYPYYGYGYYRPYYRPYYYGGYGYGGYGYGYGRRRRGRWGRRRRGRWLQDADMENFDGEDEYANYEPTDSYADGDEEYNRL